MLRILKLGFRHSFALWIISIGTEQEKGFFNWLAHQACAVWRIFVSKRYGQVIGNKH